MDDKELKELVEELLKQAIISLFDIHDMIKEHIDTQKALEIRDMFGKHQAAIIHDIPESEIMDICRENGIKWQHAYDLQNSYEDGATADAAKDMQNYMHQYGGIVIDNKDIPKFYKAAYSRSIARNNEIGAILENNFVDFKTIEHRVLIRDEETGAEGYTEAVQKLYINKADYDRIINIPALEPYKEFIFATDDITRISDAKESREASYEEMVSRFCSAALKRKGVDSIYDPKTNHIHIDGEYIPYEIREKFKGMGIMIETHVDHREFLMIKDMIENGKEPVNEEDLDLNREYDDFDEQESPKEEEPEEEIIEEIPEDEEEEIEEDKKEKIEEQKDQDDNDNEPVIEEREYDEEIYPEYEDDDRTSDEEPIEEDVFEEYYPEEEEIQESEYDEEREEAEFSETEENRSDEQESSQYEEERIQEEQRQEEYREQEEQRQEEIQNQELSEREAEEQYQEAAYEEQQKYEEEQRDYSEKTNEERIEEIRREYEQRQYESEITSETSKDSITPEDVESEHQYSGSEYDINSDSGSSGGSDQIEEIDRTDTFRSSNKNDDLVQIEPDYGRDGKDTGNTSDSEVHRVRNDKYDNVIDSSRNTNGQNAETDTYGSTTQSQFGSNESVFQDNKREKDRKEEFYSQAEASQIQDSFKREDRGEQFQHDSHGHSAANDQGTPVVRTDKARTPSSQNHSQTTNDSQNDTKPDDPVSSVIRSHKSDNTTAQPTNTVVHDAQKQSSPNNMTRSHSAQTADEIRSTVYQETGYNRNYVKTKSASSEAAYNSLNALNRFKNDAMRQTEYGMGKAQMGEVNQGGIAYFGGSWARTKQKEAQNSISEGFAKGEYNEIAAVLKRHGFKGDLESKEGFENLYESAVKLLDKNDLKLEKFETNGYKPLYMKKVMGVEKKTVNAKFKQMFGTEDAELADKMNKQLRKIMDARNKGKLAEQAKRMAPMKKKFKQMVKKNNDDTYSGYETLMSVKKGTENAFRMAVKIRDARRKVKVKKYQNAALHYNMKIAKEKDAYNVMARSVRRMKEPIDLDDFSMNKAKKVSETHQKRIEKLETKKKRRSELEKKMQGKINKTEEKRMWKKKKKTFVGKKEYKVHKIQTKLDKLTESGKKDFKKRRLEKQLKKQQEKLTKRKSMKKALNTVATTAKNRIQKTAIYKAGVKVLAPVKGFFGLQQFITDLIKKALIAIAPFILIGLIALVAIHIFIVIFLCMYGGLMSIVPSMSINDERLTDPYETPMGKTYGVLVDEEVKWVDSLREITAKEHKLPDFEDLIPWPEEIAAYNNLNDDNLGFEDNKMTADILGIGEEYRGKIPKVDGGQSIYFRNNNNPDTISNIKDILTLCSVHYDDGFSDFEYEATSFLDKINLELANWKDKGIQAITNIKKYFLNLLLGDGWGGPENLDNANYNNSKNELAYGTYAKALFNASHDMTSQIQSVIPLQTAHMIGEEAWSQQHDDDQSKIRGEKKTADFEDWRDFTIEGVRTVCTKKWGCYKPDALFYYNDEGVLYNKDYQTCKTKDDKELSYYVHIEDENCALIPDEEKEGHHCWIVTETDNPDFNDEDGDGVDDDDENTPKTIKTYTHECAGHEGTYCGGHIILKTVGIVHGIEGDLVGKGMSTDKEFEAEERQENDEPWVWGESIIDENHQYVHAEDNLFEIDGYIKHAYIPSTWIGWTTSNINAAYARYHQDWNYLYGIDINGCSVIDNLKKTLSPKEIQDILNEVAKNEKLDDKTRDKLKLALSHVGTAGYNQTYHGLLFEENGGENYHDSDCSGFASNVWYDELGRTIKSCANLVAWGNSQGNLRQVCDGGYEPGDIMINIGSTSNHAVVYVGTFDGQIWGVECTSANNGGIFYMKRSNSWYQRCYYLDMTP